MRTGQFGVFIVFYIIKQFSGSKMPQVAFHVGNLSTQNIRQTPKKDFQNWSTIGKYCIFLSSLPQRLLQGGSDVIRLYLYDSIKYFMDFGVKINIDTTSQVDLRCVRKNRIPN